MLCIYSKSCEDDDKYFQPAESISIMASAWDPESDMSYTHLGYIGGLQCDVWRSEDGVQITSSLAASSPTWKVRLPNCQDERLDSPSSDCSSSFEFHLNAILPGLAADGKPEGSYAVRCWTFVTDKFTSGEISVGSSQRGSSAYLGGKQVWGSAAAVKMPSAANTHLGSHWQLFVVEWLDVRAMTTLSVMDSGNPVRMDLASMRLPIGPMANIDGRDFNGDQVAPPYPAGAVVRTLVTVSDDVDRLVHYNLLPNQRSMKKPLPMAVGYGTGLDTKYPLGAYFRDKVRYSIAEGYYFPINRIPQTYTFKVGDAQASTTMVVMGSVTVLNAQPFSKSSAPRSSTFKVFLPAWVNVPTKVVVKSALNVDHSAFNFTTLQTPRDIDPSAKVDSAWDSWQWSAPFKDACENKMIACNI
eukprot:gene12852-3564_t